MQTTSDDPYRMEGESQQCYTLKITRRNIAREAKLVELDIKHIFQNLQFVWKVPGTWRLTWGELDRFELLRMGN